MSVLEGNRLTYYGFVFGAAEVTRLIEREDGAVCIRIATPYRRIEVYVSPAGRSLRVFGDGEWKREATA